MEGLRATIKNSIRRSLTETRVTTSLRISGSTFTMGEVGGAKYQRAPT